MPAQIQNCTITIPNRNAQMFKELFTMVNESTALKDIGIKELKVVDEFQGDQGTKFTYQFPVFEYDGMKIVGCFNFNQQSYGSKLIKGGYNIFSTLEGGDTDFFSYNEIDAKNTKECAICGEKLNDSDFEKEKSVMILQDSYEVHHLAHDRCIEHKTPLGFAPAYIYSFFAGHYFAEFSEKESLGRNIDTNAFYFEDKSLATIFEKATYFVSKAERKGDDLNEFTKSIFMLFKHPNSSFAKKSIKKKARNALTMYLRDYGINDVFLLNNSVPIPAIDVVDAVITYNERSDKKYEKMSEAQDKILNTVKGAGFDAIGKISSITDTYVNLKKSKLIKVRLSPTHVVEIRGSGFPYDIVDIDDELHFYAVVEWHKHSAMDGETTTKAADIIPRHVVFNKDQGNIFSVSAGVDL